MLAIALLDAPPDKAWVDGNLWGPLSVSKKTDAFAGDALLSHTKDVLSWSLAPLRPADDVGSKISRRLLSGGLAFAALAIVAGKSRGGKRVDDFTIPFELDASNHIFVATRVAGRDLTAVVDTGAGVNVIDRRVAAGLGLKDFGASRSAGMTRSLASGRVELPSIEIGAVKLATREAAVLDLSDVSASIGREVAIVLGRQFFENCLVHIDFANLRLTIQHPRDHVLPHGAHDLPLTTRDSGRLYTRASIENLPACEAMYDIGSGVPLYMSQRFADQLGSLKDRASSETASAGAEGMTVSKITTLIRIEIGGTVLTDVPVQIPPAWNQEAPVLVGLPIWRRFQNFIDIDGGRLGLIPDATSTHSAFPKDRSGIGAQRLEDRLVIVFVSPRSPAERAGLRPGDEVISLDGVACGPALFKARPRPGTDAAGTVQTLKLSSGKTVVLTLADYF